MSSYKVGSGSKNLLNATTNSGSFKSYLVYMNDGIRICSEACGCCWDKPVPSDYEAKVEYLGKRAKTGHLSIMEHSNVIILVKIPENYTIKNIDDMLDTVCAGHYLNCRVGRNNDNFYLLIGGSIRGYIEMITLSKNPQQNSLIRSITKVLYENFDARIFFTLTQNGFMNEESFKGVEPEPESPWFNALPETPYYEDEKIKIISIDNIDQIVYNLKNIIGDDIFTNNDITRIASISVLFKDMSRTATHQLFRHRNGITQESQRYVNYSEAAFADPTVFKPDRYDPNKKYTFEFGGHTFEMTANEIGEAEIGIYHYLFEQGMLKEDARSFLPGNVKCRKLYMTFCLAHYEKFIELRCHKAAQAEIRSFAIPCRDVYLSIIEKFDGSNVKTNAIDEIITDKEVIMQNIINNEPELKEEV